ncbi:sugar ABC transporter ATP-binding protein [Inquilinus sp. CAU 1745]|uniref:sugar ABC transporter ATP-binding protein n=1 Tax=Inquilinus sp. CAU 1745 TaxID=3140369 RepID=UPI00325A8A5A
MIPSNDPAPLLLMEGVSKSFSGVPALRGASLKVAAGEVHALIGQNGAGKSTMIKILTGAYRRNEGTIRWQGRDVAFSSPRRAQDDGISTIYQEINLVPYRSVAENIFLGWERRRWGLIDWPATNAAAREVLRRFGIGIDVRLPLMAYNVAIQQMVAIARAVSRDSRLVIMDEPTSSLDDNEVETLFNVIRQLKEGGVSVIFVSHRLDELYAVCDRVTIMRDGQTVTEGAPLADISRLELVGRMLGRDPAETAREAAAGQEGEEAAGRPGLLAARGLRRGRRLDHVDLDIHAGEIVGFAGLLGSGRTEAARVIFAADAAEDGTMEFAGAPASFHEPADAIRAGIGFCTEDRKTEGIIPDMSVRENLTLALLPSLSRRGIVSVERQREIVDRFIRQLGIKTSGPEQKIRELSGGNQQKVLLARWLCLGPRLLLLDEPTRGIDVGAKAEILSLIKDLARDGLGVLMISSEIEELVEDCDRIVVLRDGRSVATLTGDAIGEDSIMAAMATGDAPEGEEGRA